jgi:uncharacterized protein
MSAGLLPHTVNTRKAVLRAARYAGVLGAEQLPQYREILDPVGATPLDLRIGFDRDDEDRQVVTVQLRARVSVECQRCLARFEQQLDSQSALAIVRSDEEAKQLPAAYEPLLAGEETDLWALAAEELALALPVVSYHPVADCSAARHGSRDDTQARAEGSTGGSGEGSERQNPFSVLATLLESADDGTDNGDA